MNTILQNSAIDKLPMKELTVTLDAFMEPVLMNLPEKRLREVAKLAVQGVIGGQSPLITQMARGVKRADETIWPVAKRLYRFIWNKRFSHRDLLKGLYGIAQHTVAVHAPARLIVALDPVNFETPYTKKLEGVSTVMKSTPPGPIVSENREIYRSIRTTRALFPHAKLCFVADSGLDDQKIFAQMDLVGAEFIIRACYNRKVEVYNERLDRWEEELLDDLTATVPLPLELRVAFTLTATVPLPLELRVAFTHARKVRVAEIGLGWLKIRIPGKQQVLWALVAYESELDRTLVLITNIPILTPHDAEAIYTEWRYRPQIEHTYRFDQEDGLDVEDVRVQTMERMRRIFVIVLIAALFVYHVAHAWPRHMVLWLRRLGGKLGLSSDLDGPYVLLAGIRAVWITVTTLAFAAQHPFPRGGGTCG